MNAKNVRTMAVTAVVIVICLLFSWVQYGDTQSEDRPGYTFDGTWYPVYSYSSGGDLEVNVPESVEIVSSDGTLTVGYLGYTTEFRTMSDREAVSVEDGIRVQLYLEGDNLFLIQESFEPSAIAYVAMTRDSTATLPSDLVDLEGSSYDVTLRMTDGKEFQDTGAEATVTVDSHSFHVARMTIASGDTVSDAIGFVKSDGQRTVVTGAISGPEGQGQFNMVVEDGQVSVSMFVGYNCYVGGSTEVVTDLSDGELLFDGGVVMEVDVEAGMATIGNGSEYVPGMVLWTMGDDYLSFGVSVLYQTGSEYRLLAGSGYA